MLMFHKQALIKAIIQSKGGRLPQFSHFNSTLAPQISR